MSEITFHPSIYEININLYNLCIIRLIDYKFVDILDLTSNTKHNVDNAAIKFGDDHFYIYVAVDGSVITVEHNGSYFYIYLHDNFIFSVEPSNRQLLVEDENYFMIIDDDNMIVSSIMQVSYGCRINPSIRIYNREDGYSVREFIKYVIDNIDLSKCKKINKHASRMVKSARK